MIFDKAAFFDVCRNGIMGPTLDTDEVSGAEAILNAMAGAPLAYAAYALATAWHETAHTMQPVKEFGGPRYLTRMYDITGDRAKLAKSMGNAAPGDGIKYCGRGYVQLTWKANYARAAKETGFDLVNDPDLAMRRDIAATIMRKGMEEGWFTGKALAHFLPKTGPSNVQAFTQARRIINGFDKAALIGGYAVQFQKALHAAGCQ